MTVPKDNLLDAKSTGKKFGMSPSMFFARKAELMAKGLKRGYLKSPTGGKDIPRYSELSADQMIARALASGVPI